MEIGSLLPSQVQRYREVLKGDDEEARKRLLSAISEWLASQVVMSLDSESRSPEIAERVSVSFHKLASAGAVKQINDFYIVEDTENFIPRGAHSVDTIGKQAPRKWFVTSFAGDKHVNVRKLNEILCKFHTRVERPIKGKSDVISVGIARN